jgi:tetraacyldisaccharide 4'-kinase
LVGRDRIKNAKKAREEYNVDTIILDDGFQHWRLFRDLDIVLIDVNCPFGNNHLIPRGILREPLNSLKRAELVVLTKVDLKEENIPLISKRIKEINSKAEIFKARYSPQDFVDVSEKKYPLLFIKDKRVCLLCGIADPDSFEFTLKNLGAELILKFIFFDHYMYKEKDINRIINSCIKNNIKIIVTTEKDNVRLRPFHKRLQPYLFILRSKMKILENEDDFFRRTDNIYFS